MRTTADKLRFIAYREGRTTESIQLLLARWCYPVLGALPTAVENALADTNDWRAWVDWHHPDLVDSGYYDGDVQW
jgi:hypothetical protein